MMQKQMAAAACLDNFMSPTITYPKIIDNTGTTKASISSGIKVTVHIPENVQESVRQQKINKIYDILSPKASL